MDMRSRFKDGKWLVIVGLFALSFGFGFAGRHGRSTGPVFPAVAYGSGGGDPPGGTGSSGGGSGPCSGGKEETCLKCDIAGEDCIWACVADYFCYRGQSGEVCSYHDGSCRP
jgi:hypothetical protein